MRLCDSISLRERDASRIGSGGSSLVLCKKNVVDQAVRGPQWLAACMGKLFEMSEQ
jgi:hypothetical protein